MELLPQHRNTSVTETRVMQNLGYFALAARPGAYSLALKAGPSSDTFRLRNAYVGLASWTPKNVKHSVSLRKGKRSSDVFLKTFGKKRGISEGQTGDSDLPTVHIFSVASGHAYERLVGVMLTSVRKHTDCQVHVWMLDQFLSPSFKNVQIPALSKSLNFEYHFVSYKWPSWLMEEGGEQIGIRGDKQRLIWAYKILFLDVLFPLHVDRIIFLDSDIVVRADIRELWEMDMEGHAYGFVPFCRGTYDDPVTHRPIPRANNATIGYRFWESGFWKSHLGDTPYHISALFVVDLVEFRRQSLGDTLRSTYQGLGRGEDSLSNLDQDLPNYVQMNEPIFSLPQEWLWCESWCSDEVKPLAKAIDLCQNPQTKEPKMEMAKRVIAEWEAHDAFRESVVGAGDGVSQKQEL